MTKAFNWFRDNKVKSPTCNPKLEFRKKSVHIAVKGRNITACGQKITPEIDLAVLGPPTCISCLKAWRKKQNG